MKHKVSELEGALLDAAVAKAEGFPSFWVDPGDESRAAACVLGPARAEDARFDWCPSTAWEQGGPIIEREKITVIEMAPVDDQGEAHPMFYAFDYFPGRMYFDEYPQGAKASGPTYLIAAMRAYVTSKLGEEVELP